MRRVDLWFHIWPSNSPSQKLQWNIPTLCFYSLYQTARRSSSPPPPSLPTTIMQADECDTNLALSIGGGKFKSNKNHGDEEKPFNCLAMFPSQEGEEADGRVRKQPRSASRSEDSEETETEAGDVKEARGCGVDHRAVGRTKKLRLSKEQLALLEDSFTEHNILNLVSTCIIRFLHAICFGQSSSGIDNRLFRHRNKSKNWPVS